MKSNWQTIHRLAWGILVILMVIGVICLFLPRYNKLRVMQQRRDGEKEENRRLEARTKEVRAFSKRFMIDPRYVERVARELGMVKPGEIVIKYMDEGQEQPTENNY
jgi:cell division protein FtsB